MKVVFRTDSSRALGGGHLSRCLTLAGKFRERGHSVFFVSRDLDGNLNCKISEAGFNHEIIPHRNKDDRFDPIEDYRATAEIIKKSGSIDWLIVDHYSLDSKWETGFVDLSDNLMVIDDLADRNHACDILLDQNLFNHPEERYRKHLPESCLTLYGPRYALLRPEFENKRKTLKKRDGKLRGILITMGASDPNNVIEKTLTGISICLESGNVENSLTVDVVPGPGNSCSGELKEKFGNLDAIDFKDDNPDMAQLMAKADLCIGAGGSTTWERCCLGLPTLFIAAGDRDGEIAANAARAGAGEYLGRYNEVWEKMIADKLNHLYRQPVLLRDWSQAALSLVDGNGAERVFREILTFRKKETAV